MVKTVIKSYILTHCESLIYIQSLLFSRLDLYEHTTPYVNQWTGLWICTLRHLQSYMCNVDKQQRERERETDLLLLYPGHSSGFPLSSCWWRRRAFIFLSSDRLNRRSFQKRLHVSWNTHYCEKDRWWTTVMLQLTHKLCCLYSFIRPHETRLQRAVRNYCLNFIVKTCVVNTELTTHGSTGIWGNSSGAGTFHIVSCLPV